MTKESDSADPQPETPLTAPAPANAIDELITLMEATQTPAAPEVQPPSALPEMRPTSPEAEHPAIPSAEHFMAWLKHAIATRKLILNDTKALVHTVDNTAFLVTPGIFQRYAQEHPQTAILAKQANQQDWQWLQKRFEKLNLHRKHPSGLNIWTCEVSGSRRIF